jgi:acyl-CoA reductase-like NAD-dependent aldehyde dehydrogenase
MPFDFPILPMCWTVAASLACGNDALPFGGWKHSGLSRELGRQGLEFFRRPKRVILDPVPAIQSWWYRYGEAMFHPASRA